MSGVMPARVLAWREAWHSGDAGRVAMLYAEGGTHDSAKVAAAMPALGRTTLSGRDEIRVYAAQAFKRVHWVRFEVLNVVETESLSAMEYLRTSGIDSTPHRVVEILEWDADLLKAVRVYHP